MRIGGGNRALIGIAACVGLVLVAMYVDGQHRPSAQALAPDTKRAVQAVPVRVPAPVRWSTTTVMLPVGTLMRSYLLVRPETPPKRRLPVMVVLHGRTATPEIERKRTGFPEAVGAALFVYPAGFQQSWNAGTCCGGAQAAGVDDVTFLTDVVHHVLQTQPAADASRVYLVGFSNGGRMAYRLTCADPTMFRAFAVVGALSVSSCPNRKPLPFTDVTIAQDPLVPLGPATAQVAGQGRTNRCLTSSLPVAARGTATVTTWSACMTKAPVQLVVYPGTIHAWPAGDANTPPPQRLIWQFFQSLPAGAT